MKKRWAFFFAFASLLVGFVVGGLAGVRFWQSFDEVALENQLISDAGR